MLFKILKVTRMFIWRDIILFMNDPIEFVYLHGFSDASTLVYGGCIYIKSVSKAGNIKFHRLRQSRVYFLLRRSLVRHVLNYWGILF